MQSTVLCSVEGCERGSKHRGYCPMHYRRMLKDGDPGEPEPRKVKRAHGELCGVDGCGALQVGGGLCSSHRYRLDTDGDVNGGYRRHYFSPEERFRARTKRVGECLEWTGGGVGNGYGLITVGGRQVLAHRYAWEAAHGPIPAGMFVDHICYNRACVEVRHLRLATKRENGRNRSGAQANNELCVRGVFLRKDTGKYVVQVHLHGSKYRKEHDTLELAKADAERVRNLAFGEFAGLSTAHPVLVADDLDEGTRGSNGFGSTGR